MISHWDDIEAEVGRLTLLTYGMRDSSDVAYYPRSIMVSFSGIGLIARAWNGSATGTARTEAVKE